jgi:PAS domain S-box-containing protein
MSKSIRQRLLIVLGLTSLAPLVLVSLYSYSYFNAVWVNSNKIDLDYLNSQTTAQLNDLLFKAIDQVFNWSERTEWVEAVLHPAQMSSYVEMAARETHLIAALFVLDKAGKILMTNKQNKEGETNRFKDTIGMLFPPYNDLDHKDISIAKWQDLHIGSQGVSTVILSFPIFDKSKEYVGMMVGLLNQSTIRAVLLTELTELKKRSFDSGVVAIIDKERHNVLTAVSESDIALNTLKLQGEVGSSSIVSLNGEGWFAFSHRTSFGENELLIVSLISQRNLLHTTQKLLQISIIVYSLVLIFVIVVVVLCAKTLSGPIREITTQAERFGSGDYLSEIRVKAQDEIGRLATVLNHARKNIALYLDDILNMKNYNESILESLNSGVITLDIDRHIVTCNASALQILNTRIDEIMGMSADDYFSDNTWVVDMIDHTLKTALPKFAIDAGFFLGNGEEISINLTVVPLINVEKELIGLVLVFEDITSEKRIINTFGRYLSKEVVEELLHSPEGLKLGGEIREVTFLVCDLRGFTSIAARVSPHESIDILNRYLGRMVDIIEHYRRTIDEFQGDGILAFFGAPLAASDDPERAIACAIEMQRALVDINTEQRWHHLPDLAMGIGLNTGEAIVGNIGSEKRAKYGAVGNAITIAYRIESYTVGGQILISDSTYQRVRSLVHVSETLELQFKGLDQLITVYEIAGLAGNYQLALPEKVSGAFTTLEPPLPIACFPVHNKMVSSTAIAGYITHLAISGAEVALEEQVGLHTNLKIILAPQDISGLSEVYAKVLALKPLDEESLPAKARLEFTSLPSDAKLFLEQQGRRL